MTLRFFWKIFFTTMFISTTCSALAGYTLINSSFRTLLNNEVQIAYDFGDIVSYSLANELKEVNLAVYSLSQEEKEKTIKKTINQVAQSIDINSTNQKISFGILDKNGTMIFSSLTENLDKNTISSLKENEKVWTLKKKKNGIFVQTMRPVVYFKSVFYIETIRNVSFIFDNQKLQYSILLKIMLGMLVFAGLITFIISKFLMRQIVALTKATQNISAGILSKRVTIKGSDEFAVLSQNFNQMAEDLEEKIYQLKEEAERKELFVGAFSHELKTPLTSIIGYADMIRRKEMSQEQLNICAQYIFTEGKRLETLSMRLMDFIVLKKQKIILIPTNIASILEETCLFFLPQMKQLNIELLCTMEDALIKLEPDLIKTVFINLIDNAKKAIDAEGLISIIGKWNQNCYIISIHDNGKGMEKQELSKIKEAFYMVDKSRARKQGGAGLGLAICDEILKLHGFEITFESAVEIGTTVTITMEGEKNG